MSPDEPDLNPLGFDAGGLETTRDLLNEGLERGLYTGAAMWASHRGVSKFLHCVGHTDDSDSAAVGPHTLFDLASLTKPVVTAPAVLLLAEDGVLDLGQRVGEFLVGRKTDYVRDVTLFHLLTHTSGLPAWRDLSAGAVTRHDAVDALLNVPLEAGPGTRYEYSCLGYIMLGLVVEAVTGEGLDVFAHRRIFEPLGMVETLFNPGPLGNIAYTGFCPRRGLELRGIVHDENSCAFRGVSGNAGLFSTVHDLAVFCHSVTFASQYTQCSPFGLAIRSKIFANALAVDSGGHTLGGWFIWPNPLLPAGELVTKATVGHSGFTGTAIILDPINEVCSVLLTNRVCRPGDGTSFRKLRRKILDSLTSAIVW